MTFNADRTPAISNETFAKLVVAARDASRVSGLTHNFYRYPARFSPKFVREVISTFSKPGDWVLDPFMGGGTTLVEAAALGRNAVGSDISSLAAFVVGVKTTLLNQDDIESVRSWAARLDEIIDVRGSSAQSQDYEAAGYYRHLTSPHTWRLRKAIEQAIASAARLSTTRRENFARCIALRVSQWALDGRKHLPTLGEFRDAFRDVSREMLAGAVAFRKAVGAHDFKPKAIALHRSAVGLESESCFAKHGAPKLIVTSPPYPGIHVLYHRWQVDGRKETPAPFWIANKLDGAGASYYTFGDRKALGNWTYFEQLHSTFQSIAAVCDVDTTIVQVVAFSKPGLQLPRYLEVMRAAGLVEVHCPAVEGKEDGRLWRTIPNRKWHADQRGEIPASQEVVLFHRLAEDSAP